MAIINATQHNATPEQVAEGICNMTEGRQEQLKAALTLPAHYTHAMLVEAATTVVKLVHSENNAIGWAEAVADGETYPGDDSFQNYLYRRRPVMVGGLPALMPILQQMLQKDGWEVCFSQSDRVSVDTPQPDGSVKKVSVFKHTGLYYVPK